MHDMLCMLPNSPSLSAIQNHACLIRQFSFRCFPSTEMLSPEIAIGSLKVPHLTHLFVGERISKHDSNDNSDSSKNKDRARIRWISPSWQLLFKNILEPFKS
jgi:hypothetical protein